MSSWLRSAVNKAVEVGNKNNLTRVVRNYADTVVQQAGQAVAEGAKILQDRMGGSNYKSYRQTIKRLEEASVSCRGPERSQLIRRWLTVLKEIEKLCGVSVEDKGSSSEQFQPNQEPKDSTRKLHLVLYFDPDLDGEPMNFLDVFLYSQALEGIIISMILEPPNEEEVSLLLDLFGLCLTGGKEVHNAIVSSIQDLGKVLSSYEDEVLVKREELLQFAQTAITGLKINADVGRVDSEAYKLKKKLEDMKASRDLAVEVGEETSKERTFVTIEALKEALAHVRTCSRLEGLLLKKKSFNSGDSPEVHAQKVDKLKVLSESLASSTTKAEKRISDHRSQKEEALKFRVSKTTEATEIEKELGTEISALEKQRDELEAELKKVNISLGAVQARLRNTMEERDQFYDANDKIVAHLKTKEDELLRSIATCRTEAGVLDTWLNFLEDTWVLQHSDTDIKEKQASEELEKHESYFVGLVINLLSAYEKELKPFIDRIGKFVDNLKNLGEGSGMMSRVDTEGSKELNPRQTLEEEYLDLEAKIITAFSVVDNMKEQFYSQQGKLRKDEPRVKELFDKLEKMREEFEKIERPNLELENPTIPEPEVVSPREKSPQNIFLQPPSPVASVSPKVLANVENPKTEQVLDTEDELAKFESEFGAVSRDYTEEEVGDWEFDELEKELTAGDSAPSK
ncbi:cingulin-like protein 1 [Impatiens glandulifera]|uniref:cingulin-like protein 1 n=1 Tax=Impatiens glandulifera TaxID=253017 RepID=UPI001FB0F899|nr:cingulin-like protein 1 [Impatiens glandulifera]